MILITQDKARYPEVLNTLDYALIQTDNQRQPENPSEVYRPTMMQLPFPFRDSADSFYQFDNITDFVGEGASATVYKAVALFDSTEMYPARRITSGMMVALKVLKKNNLVSPKIISDLINEVEVSSKLQHPNCIPTLECFQTPTQVVMVLPYHPGSKDLFYALQSSSVSELVAQEVMYQLLLALDYLHTTMHVVHRDVKPENIIVRSDEVGNLFIQLTDFGLVKRVDTSSAKASLPYLSGGGDPCGPPTYHKQPNKVTERPRKCPYAPSVAPADYFACTDDGCAARSRSLSSENEDDEDSCVNATPCGTFKYAAPETVRSVQLSAPLVTTKGLLPRVDIFSAGVVMYRMLSGALPFKVRSQKSATVRAMEAGAQFSGPAWSSVSEEAIDLCRILLQYEPSQRPCAHEALQHPWFAAQREATAQNKLCSVLPDECDYLSAQPSIVSSSDLGTEDCNSLHERKLMRWDDLEPIVAAPEQLGQLRGVSAPDCSYVDSRSISHVSTPVG